MGQASSSVILSGSSVYSRKTVTSDDTLKIEFFMTINDLMAHCILTDAATGAVLPFTITDPDMVSKIRHFDQKVARVPTNASGD